MSYDTLLDQLLSNIVGHAGNFVVGVASVVVGTVAVAVAAEPEPEAVAAAVDHSTPIHS